MAWGKVVGDTVVRVWGNLISLPQGSKVWALWGQEVTHFGTCRGLNEESVASAKDLQVSEK